MEAVSDYPSSTLPPKNKTALAGARAVKQRAELALHVDGKSHMTCTLDSIAKAALVAGTSAGAAAGHDLTAIGDKARQTSHILEVNIVNLIYAEGTDFSPPLEPRLTIVWSHGFSLFMIRRRKDHNLTATRNPR